MAIPSYDDLERFLTTPLTNQEWNDNNHTFINWLNDGTAEVTFLSITVCEFFNLPQYVDSEVSGILGMTEGSMIMNVTTHRPMFYDGERWQTL